jgi:hypothetical protein
VIPSGYQGFKIFFSIVLAGYQGITGYHKKKYGGLVFVQGIEASAQAFTLHKNIWERGL